MLIHLDHIAILTTSLEKCAAQLPPGFVAEEITDQPGEGTREQYVQSPGGLEPSLLLVEAVHAGPYRSALERRGPGLHHLGCSTDCLDEATDHFASNGLLLHPISLKTRASNLVWMCRPGVPFLLELQHSEDVGEQRPGDVLIELPHAPDDALLPIVYVPGTLIRPSGEKAIKISIGGHSVSVVP